ncbi:hypothetical protein GF377_03235, partial [candidate division GN15 bacterium]|nr:hypothetical protein [candidate division GN15 bacterium]
MCTQRNDVVLGSIALLVLLVVGLWSVETHAQFVSDTSFEQVIIPRVQDPAELPYQAILLREGAKLQVPVDLEGTNEYSLL